MATKLEDDSFKVFLIGVAAIILLYTAIMYMVG